MSQVLFQAASSYLFNINSSFTEATCDVSPFILNLYKEVEVANARINGYPHPVNIEKFALFVGNGYIGVPLNGDFSLHIRHGRTLSLHIPYYPAVRIKMQIPMKYMEQSALHYTNGIVIVDRCYYNKIRVSYTYFTHRSIPSIFVQEIYFKNAFSEPFIFDLEQKGHTVWDSTSKRTIKYVKNIKNFEK